MNCCRRPARLEPTSDEEQHPRSKTNKGRHSAPPVPEFSANPTVKPPVTPDECDESVSTDVESDEDLQSSREDREITPSHATVYAQKAVESGTSARHVRREIIPSHATEYAQQAVESGTSARQEITPSHATGYAQQAVESGTSALRRGPSFGDDRQLSAAQVRKPSSDARNG